MADLLGISRAMLYQLYDRHEWPSNYLRSAAEVMSVDLAWLDRGEEYAAEDPQTQKILREIDASVGRIARELQELREKVRKLSITRVRGDLTTKASRRGNERASANRQTLELPLK